jgi:hypothetical protein
VECPEHGPRQIDVPWAESGSRFTTLFECEESLDTHQIGRKNADLRPDLVGVHHCPTTPDKAHLR